MSRVSGCQLSACAAIQRLAKNLHRVNKGFEIPDSRFEIERFLPISNPESGIISGLAHRPKILDPALSAIHRPAG